MPQISPQITQKPRKLDQQGFGILATLVNVIFGIILTLITLRLVFLLFNANPGNDFVAWVYNASQPFVAPFAGIFNDLALLSGRLEMATIVALVVYGLLAAVLTRLFAGSYRSHPV